MAEEKDGRLATPIGWKGKNGANWSNRAARHAPPN